AAFDSVPARSRPRARSATGSRGADRARARENPRSGQESEDDGTFRIEAVFRCPARHSELASRKGFLAAQTARWFPRNDLDRFAFSRFHCAGSAIWKVIQDSQVTTDRAAQDSAAPA